jgi:hypothetical protein
MPRGLKPWTSTAANGSTPKMRGSDKWGFYWRGCNSNGQACTGDEGRLGFDNLFFARDPDGLWVNFDFSEALYSTLNGAE